MRFRRFYLEGVDIAKATAALPCAPKRRTLRLSTQVVEVLEVLANMHRLEACAPRCAVGAPFANGLSSDGL